MAQQINLLTPILLAPRRHFSALAMAQSFGVLLLAALALTAWLSLQAGQARRDHRALLDGSATERNSLRAAIAALPSPGDFKAMEQQAIDLEQQLQRQRQLAALLAGGQGADGQRHSDLLTLLARTIPPSVWIQELRWVDARLELAGATLDTAALRTWMSRLAEQPQLAGLQLSQLRVERWSPAAQRGSDADATLLGALTPPPGGQPMWAFRLRSERASASPAAASGVRP